MPRKLRIEYPGAIYHVMNRGDRREPIFKDDEDRRRFLSTLGEACEKTDWRVHCYCLMSNHFHMVVETPQPNLVFGMKWFLGVYTKRFNIRHKLCGHLFAGRYKALVVDGSGNGYLRTVGDYVHLNPVRAGLIAPTESLQRYQWSSFGEYLKPPEQRPPWLRVDRLFGEKGIPGDTAAGREQFAALSERRRADNEADYEALRKDWILGSEAFRRELLAAATERIGPSHYGAQRQETEAQKAERVITEQLSRLRWGEEQMLSRRKGDPAKVELALRLRQETSVSLKWIANRLRMGSWTYVSLLINELKNPKPTSSANLLPLFQY
jgi:REP element-mobilizing transposase RayT